jgi:hypothetical protein
MGVESVESIDLPLPKSVAPQHIDISVELFEGVSVY